MSRERFWELMFYASIATLIIWAILKSVGVINTPAWLEFGVPVIGLAFAALSFYQNLADKFTALAVTIAGHTVRLEHLERDVEQIKSKLTSMTNLYKRPF